MMNNKKTFLIAGLALLATGLLLAGCESDAVAPQDEAPALTQENAAYQSAMVALAITEIGPQFLNFTPVKTVYNYNFVGYEYVAGAVSIDYLLGGANGSDSTPSEADYAHLWTLGDGLTLTYEGSAESAIILTADLMADIDQMGGTATILSGSQGTLMSGAYNGSFTITGVGVGGSGYPTAGNVTFIGGAHTLGVTFNGTNTVPVDANGVTIYTLNLDTGDLTPIPPAG